MKINEKQLVIGLSMSQQGNDISTLRDVLKRSQMHLPQDTLQSAKELAALIQKGTYLNRLKQVKALDNGTGMYHDFKKGKPMPYPNEGRTINQNNVINEVSEFARDSNITYDDLVIRIFDTLETSKAYLPLSEFQTLETVRTRLSENAKPETIAAEFVNRREEDGSIVISDLNY
jgi:hypothetical protein